ncbi:hypothetical protein L3073_12910 [Ancylomarina sp. DW003]|nr:hypothetical protein [Ancylomarina sp. DW003]MDE5423112.1 hypothetical protein [Ancylomarina sp. DW003]
MKANQFLLLALLLVFLMLTAHSCEKDNENYMHKEGYIVGFDPCTINHKYRIGYVIISTDLQDTLLTYNLSDPNYKMPASVLNSQDTLYKIPKSSFDNYKNSPYFPNTLRYKYPVRFSYSIAKEDEMVYNMCTADIISIDFIQMIIKSLTKQ